MAAAKRVLEEAAPLLPYDAVFRIEVSLSSQTTSAVVMRTTARLYNLEGVQSSKPSIGDAEWKSVAYGAPCIQLIRHGNGGPNSMFTIRVVVAEVESGISLWEGVVGSSSQYRAMQSNFHTFSSADCTYALQFVSELEAERMLESMQDLLSQQQNLMVGVASQTSLESLVFKKPSSRPPRRLSKKDISSPCNFKHVSGITVQRTLSCEQELRGTIQRKMRSLSLSNLSRHKSGDEMEIGRKLSSKRARPAGRGISKEESPESVREVRRTDPQRMSLPSHFRKKERKPLSSVSFMAPQSQLTRALSQSSGDIPNAQQADHTHSLTEPHTLTATAAHAIQRRHTVKEESVSQTTPTHKQATPTHKQATPTNRHGLKRSVTSISQGAVQMQHVAIASSDIVGWTADGRLIVQMPANGGVARAEGGVAKAEGGVARAEGGMASVNPGLTRRASTGQFASDQPFPQQLRHGNSELIRPAQAQKTLVHSVSERSTAQKTLAHSVSERSTIQKRPLPPTPLDIALPHSQGVRKPIITTTQAGTGTNTLTNRPSVPQQPHPQKMESQPTPTTASQTADIAPPPPASHGHSDSLDASLQEVTEQMSRALAQFDDLLGVVQTSL